MHLIWRPPAGFWPPMASAGRAPSCGIGRATQWNSDRSATGFWFNQNLKPHAFDRETPRRFLAADGFRWEGSQLRDREGHPVEFSVVTNAGNRARERAAAMIQ